MVKKHSIYMTNDGRISVCGVNSKNVKYIAGAIKDVVENYWNMSVRIWAEQMDSNLLIYYFQAI